jgi:protein O-GlcNAc transferase
MIPRRAREAMERGLNLANDKSDYGGSLAQFQRAVREYPDYYEAYLQMGLVYLKMGNAAKSEEMLRTSIDMSRRKYADALFTLALVYSNQKRFAAAEPLAREAAKLSPNSWEANLELARALHGIDQSAEAEASALEALRIRPDNPQTHLILANIHLKMRNYAALVRDLDSYLLISPTGPEADQARQMREQVLERLSNLQPSTP